MDTGDLVNIFKKYLLFHNRININLLNVFLVNLPRFKQVIVKDKYGKWRMARVWDSSENDQSYQVKYFGEKYPRTIRREDVLRGDILGDSDVIGKATINFCRVGLPGINQATLNAISGVASVMWCSECERYYRNYLKHVFEAHPDPTINQAVKQYPEILNKPKNLTKKEQEKKRKELRIMSLVKALNNDVANDVCSAGKAVERVRNKRTANWEDDEDEENAPKRQCVDLNIGQPIDENDISYIDGEDEGAVGGAVGGAYGGAYGGADDGAFGGPDDGATCSKYCR